MLAAALAACGSGGGRAEITVFAAASLREACADFETEWEAAHASDLVFNFGASDVLARQALASGKADLLLSADVEALAPLEQAGLVVERTREWLSNQLVVVVPAGSELEIGSASDLAGPRVARVSLGAPERVPAGRYAKLWLESRGQWAAVEPKVAPAVDARAALAAVESGAADAGVVYSTDVGAGASVRVVLRVAPDEGPRIEYVAALLRGPGDERGAAEAFAWIAGERGRAAFARRGFLAGAGVR